MLTGHIEESVEKMTIYQKNRWPYKVFLFFSFLLHSCCNDKVEKSPDTPLPSENTRVKITYGLNNSTSIDSLRRWQHLAYNGDEQCYQKLRFYYFKSGDASSFDFLPYAIRMANKYNNHGANYDVYISISSEGGGSKGEYLEALDSITLSLIRLHLGRACLYENKQAKEDYRAIFKDSYK